MPSSASAIHQTLLNRARFWAGILARLPGVEAIFLVGSLAQGKASAQSDIDYLIIARPGRIFTARFWTLCVLQACNRLAHGAKNHAGKVCPNHFLTSDSLEILEKDPYAAYVYTQGRFLAGDRRLWQRFVTTNQEWVRDFACSFAASFPPVAIPSRPRYLPGEVMEKGVRALQRAIHRRNVLSEHARVWLRDTEIRLHPDPKSRYFQPARPDDSA